MTKSGTPSYKPGDYVKAEFKNVRSGEREWMWVIVRRCDVRRRLIFGTLDNIPLVNADRLHLGQKLLIAFDTIREHRLAARSA